MSSSINSLTGLRVDIGGESGFVMLIRRCFEGIQPCTLHGVPPRPVVMLSTV